MAKSLLWKLSHDRSAMMDCQQLITVWSWVGFFPGGGAGGGGVAIDDLGR